MLDDTSSDPALCPVYLPRQDLTSMIRLMRTLHRLAHLSSYQNWIKDELPFVAHFNPNHESVMMGYDFHLTDQGPKLIEVNTNAGGGLLAYQTHYPDFPSGPFNTKNRHQNSLLNSFVKEMQMFSNNKLTKPNYVVILDEEPEKQFLLSEMLLLLSLFRYWGIKGAVAGPEALNMSEKGVFHQGERVDLIYNRHCDFYLEKEELSGLKEAYLNRTVCLTPNPHTYGLFADKRRMPLWKNQDALKSMGLTQQEREHLDQTIPSCQLFLHQNPEQLWKDRKQLVFKPVTSHGSRGVLLGTRITRSRFANLDPETTLIQSYAPPSMTDCKKMNKKMKTDFRLFVYQNRVLGVAARIYRGQVTNFQQPGNGYAPVHIGNPPSS